MAVDLWIAIYVVQMIFWVWVVFLGGADRLEGTAAAGCLLNVLAPNWSADAIRLWGWFGLIGSTCWFILGLVAPGARL